MKAHYYGYYRYREGWTLPLHRLFNKAMKILHADQLARLAHTNQANESIHRRIGVDKTAKRFRQVLASVLWDLKMIQWLHNTLCDHLPLEYLASYMDVLQTLRARVPTLVDKMMAGRVSNLYQHPNLAVIAREGQRVLLKRKWDPAASFVTDQKIVSPASERKNVNLIKKGKFCNTLNLCLLPFFFFSCFFRKSYPATQSW